MKTFQCQGLVTFLPVPYPGPKDRQDGAGEQHHPGERCRVKQSSLPVPGPSGTTVPETAWVHPGRAAPSSAVPPAKGCPAAGHEEDTVTLGTKEGLCCQTGRAKPELSTPQNQQKVGGGARSADPMDTGRWAWAGREPGCWHVQLIQKCFWGQGCPS